MVAREFYGPNLFILEGNETRFEVKRISCNMEIFTKRCQLYQFSLFAGVREVTNKLTDRKTGIPLL